MDNGKGILFTGYPFLMCVEKIIKKLVCRAGFSEIMSKSIWRSMVGRQGFK
jgi:hypothetical protein